MASESYLNTLDKCPKQIPRPKVRKVQGEPSADSTECSEMNYSEKDVKGKEAQYLGYLPPPYQYDNPAYDGERGHVTTGYQNEAVSKGCCDKRCCIISILLVLLCLASVTIAALVVIYKPDDTVEERTTPVPTTAIPGWTEWSAWSECDVTCGGGYRSRGRTCNPPGHECVGPQDQTELCATSRCPLPVYGSWSSWSGWSACTESCGGGTQVRSRTCSLDPDDLPCPGDPQQERDCNTWDCPSCSRDCPDNGQGNSPACDRCLCTSNSDFRGLVTDHNYLPLEGVTVVDSHWPGVVLAESDVTGVFTIQDPCNGIVLEVQKVNYVTNSLTIGSNTFVKMDRVEHLSISGDPTDKQRLAGESVSFCCNVTGKPLPDNIEWFQDGAIVATFPYETNASYTIHNVTASHEGYYRCRANNDYSSVYSENARLTVKASSSEFCSGNPSPNPVALPVGCSYNGETTVDAGYCAPLPCRNETHQTGSCWVDKQSCCGPTEYQYLEVDCQSFILPIKTVKSCGCTACSKRVINIVGRAISLEDKTPVKFAEVMINGSVMEQTNSDGDFQLSIPTGTRRIAITIRDSSFGLSVETSKVMHFPEKADGTYYVYIEMLTVRDSSDFDPNVGVAFFLGAQKNPFGAVIVPASSFFSLSGQPVIDTVKAELTFIDPRNMSDVQNAPGDLSFIDPEGNRQLLQTKGMFSLSFRSTSTQEKLQIKDKVMVIMNSANVDLSIATPKLWSLNKDTGNWQDDGDLQNDTELLQKIPSRFRDFLTPFSDYMVGNSTIDVDYTWSNFDYESERACHSKVRVFEDNNFSEASQMEDFQIEVLVEDGGSYSASDIRAFSDNGVDTNGYCVVHLCERQPETADFTAFLIGYHGSNPDENRLRPALRNNSGIDSDTMQAIEYNAIDHQSYGAIEYKPRLHAAKGKGPLYDWDGFDKGIKDWAYSEACSNAKFTSENHFRLYATDVKDPCSYEYNFITEPNCDLTPLSHHLNVLSWYAQAHADEYLTCFIKVLVENGKETRFRAISKMGNLTLGAGSMFPPVYGIRDSCPQKSTASVCLEVKHPSPVTNCNKTINNVETFLQVGHYWDEDTKDICKRTEVNEALQGIHGDRFVGIDNKDLFQMHVGDYSYGQIFGIYCHRGTSSIRDTKQEALKRCMAGSDTPYLRKPEEINNDNWAVKFECNKS